MTQSTAAGNIAIANIIIGDRRREELGDIGGLADSISDYGLLHPVVLARTETPNRYQLVAGFRRLEACKRLGWQRIPCTLFDELTERELREIELEENLRRKDFTEYERSKDMVALAELVAERLTEEAERETEPGFRSTVEQNPQERNVGGRPSKPDSVRAVADEIGVAPATIINARAHVAAVEQYPTLREVPKMAAIETAREAAKLPEPERAPFVASQADREYSDWAKEYDRKYKNVYKRLRDATSYDFCVDAPEGEIEEWIASFCDGPDELADCITNLNQSITRLTRIRDYLHTRTSRLSIVKGGKGT